MHIPQRIKVGSRTEGRHSSSSSSTCWLYLSITKPLSLASPPPPRSLCSAWYSLNTAYLLPAQRPSQHRHRHSSVSTNPSRSPSVPYPLHPRPLLPHQADYYPEYLYASVIMLSVDRPSHLTPNSDPTAATAASTSAAAAAATASSSSNTKQQLRRATSSVAGAHPRISDSGSSIAAGVAGGAGGGGDAVFGAGLNRAVRARLFGAAGAKKRQVERRAAAANCPALLQPMQPTVEQASMFLFRCALAECAVLCAENGGLGGACAAGGW